MQCKCGAALKDKKAVRDGGRIELAFGECPACKRVVFHALRSDGMIIARGQAAKAHWLTWGEVTRA